MKDLSGHVEGIGKVCAVREKFFPRRVGKLSRWEKSKKWRRYKNPPGGQLPLGEIALMCQSQQSRVRRGSGANKTRGASCSPQERQLPLGDTALWCRSRQNRVCRGSGADKVRSAICPPLGARHPAPEGAQLPPGDIALMFQSQHSCGRRGKVSNKTQGAVCSPLGAPAKKTGSAEREPVSMSMCNYLLENWGARRAALSPYFNRLSDDFP